MCKRNSAGREGWWGLSWPGGKSEEGWCGFRFTALSHVLSWSSIVTLTPDDYKSAGRSMCMKNPAWAWSYINLCGWKKLSWGHKGNIWHWNVETLRILTAMYYNPLRDLYKDQRSPRELNLNWLGRKIIFNSKSMFKDKYMCSYNVWTYDWLIITIEFFFFVKSSIIWSPLLREALGSCLVCILLFNIFAPKWCDRDFLLF